MPEMAFRVLVIGSGELGTRHLQAIAATPSVAAIEIVDPRPEALVLGRSRVADVAARSPDTTLRWLRGIEETTPGADLCIVATQSRGRCQAIRQAVDVARCRSFLIEKPVARSVREFDDLSEFSRRQKLRIWVNCKRRAYPISKHIKSRIDPSEPINVTEIGGGQHGLANNGIHSVDLFVHYDGAERLDSAGSRIEPRLYPSKRGADVFDLGGALHAVSNRGSQLTVAFAGNHAAPPVMTIVTSRFRWIVDEMSRTAWESERNEPWRAVPFEGDLMVSVMTRGFAEDILTRGSCELPTLAQCTPAHRFVLDELMPHFRQLIGSAVEECPVA